MGTTTNNYVKFLTGELPNLAKQDIKPGNIYFAIDQEKKYGYLVYDVDGKTRLTMSTRAEIATRFENPTTLTIGNASRELQGATIGTDGKPKKETISFSFKDIGADVKGGWENGTTEGPVLKLAVNNDAKSNIVALDPLKLAIPAASATQSGIITTGAQSLAGQKTFNNQVTIDLTKGSDVEGLSLQTPAVTRIQEVISATSSDTKYQHKLYFDTSEVRTHIKSPSTISYKLESSKGKYDLSFWPRKNLVINTLKWDNATNNSIIIPYIEEGNQCAASTSLAWKPLFYSDNGDLITSDSTVGGTTAPVYLNEGTLTACKKFAGGTAVFLNDEDLSGDYAQIYAPTVSALDFDQIVVWGKGGPTWKSSEDLSLTATKLKVDDAGSATQPIYFKDGIPVAMTFQVLTGKPTWATGFTSLSLNDKAYAAANCPGCIFVDTTSNIVYISNGKTWEGMNTYQ